MERLTSARSWSEAQNDLSNEPGYSYIWQKLQRYENTGLEPEELAQAEKEGRLVFITEKMALAMIAGARAIEKNKRLQGVIYNYDIFGELGAPKEISYFEAAKVLREAAEAALEERSGGENNA